MITSNLWNSAGINSAADIATQRDAITTNYGSYLLSQVKSQLQTDGSLSQLEQFILTDEEAYLCILLLACRDSSGNFRTFSDAVQIAYSVKISLDEAENLYISKLIDSVLASNSINLNTNASPIFSATLLKTQIQNDLKRNGVDIVNPDTQVMQFYQNAKDTGAYHYMVECYLNTGEVDTTNVTQAMRDEMAKYLFSLDLNLDIVSASIGPDSNGVDIFIDNNVDGYLAQAWTHSLRVASGDDDPISQIYSPGQITPWNNQVDYFEDVEDVQINRQRIELGAALYYIKVLDLDMHIIKATEKIVLSYVTGTLNLSPGDASNKVYRYYKKRDDRMTGEERSMAYRQAFGLGNVPVIQGGRENTEFSRLFENVNNQVVDYIQRIEGLDSGQQSVSIEGLSQSIRDLQYNISSNLVGMVQQSAHELHAQLQECIDILRDPEIMAQIVGGNQSNIWKTLETVLVDMGIKVNIPAAKTVAVEGNKMLNFIASFNHSQRHSINFIPFLNHSEAFIIAQSQLTPNAHSSVNYMDDTNEEFAEVIDDDFDNWD